MLPMTKNTQLSILCVRSHIAYLNEHRYATFASIFNPYAVRCYFSSKCIGIFVAVCKFQSINGIVTKEDNAQLKFGFNVE